jgi:hypothetical protein
MGCSRFVNRTVKIKKFWEELYMNNLMILAIIVSLSVGAVIALLILLPLLKKQGVKTAEVLQTVASGIDGVNRMTDALQTMFPQSMAVNMVDKIIEYAKIAVERAEQLCHIDKIEAADRKEEAVKFVIQSLELAGFKVTSQLKEVVEGSIEAAVMGLGHFKEIATELEFTGQAGSVTEEK